MELPEQIATRQNFHNVLHWTNWKKTWQCIWTEVNFFGCYISISEVRHFAAILSIQFLVSIKKKERKKEREKYMELPSAISLNNSTCIQWLNTLTVCSQAFNTLGLKAFKFISVLQFWSRSFNIYTIKAKLWWSIPKRKWRLLFKSNRTGLTVFRSDVSFSRKNTQPHLSSDL